jgi:hypothetical protein
MTVFSNANWPNMMAQRAVKVVGPQTGPFVVQVGGVPVQTFTLKPDADAFAAKLWGGLQPTFREVAEEAKQQCCSVAQSTAARLPTNASPAAAANQIETEINKLV